MFATGKKLIAFAVFVLCMFIFANPIVFAQNENNSETLIQRYKQILESKPREGSAFDRLYQFYLEVPGLAQMIADYQTEAEAKPDSPNIQLILGHINKRLGGDEEAISAYKRAIELAPKDYYQRFVLGKMYAALRRYGNAIEELTQAEKMSTETRAASPEELTSRYGRNCCTPRTRTPTPRSSLRLCLFDMTC